MFTIFWYIVYSLNWYAICSTKISYWTKTLNDNQIELIKKALKMRKDGFNDEGVVVLAQKIKDKLKIESDLPDVKFLYTIIADYEYLANQTFGA